MANLNRTDKKQDENLDGEVGEGENVSESGVKAKRKERKGGVETIESNLGE